MQFLHTDHQTTRPGQVSTVRPAVGDNDIVDGKGLRHRSIWKPTCNTLCTAYFCFSHCKQVANSIFHLPESLATRLHLPRYTFRYYFQASIWSSCAAVDRDHPY